MARGGGHNDGALELDQIEADHDVVLGEIVQGSAIARSSDEDLVQSLDAAYGQHPSQVHFQQARIELQRLALIGTGNTLAEIIDDEYWCDHCAEEAEEYCLDEDQVLADCKRERLELIASYEQQLRAGKRLDPIVVEPQQDGQFRILDGYHRAAAHLQAGAGQINAWIVLDENPSGEPIAYDPIQHSA